MKNLKNTARALFLTALVPGSYAAAQDITVGAQGCMPMNLPLAKTLQWRSEGLINNNTVEQWVVCPITIDTNDDELEVQTRIRNRSQQTNTVQCLYKVTSEQGNTDRSISRTSTVDPGNTVTLQVDNLDFADREALSVSCLLPPQFSITSFSYE